MRLRAAPVYDEIDTYRRVGLMRDGDVYRVGPFLAGFDREGPNPFLNYAVPDTGTRPDREDIERLVDRFRERGRIPRFEYTPAAAPAVEAALLAAGFVVEARPVAMTCRPGAHVALSDVDGVRVAPVEPDAVVDLAGTCLVAHLAFEEEGMPDQHDMDRLARMLSAGGAAVLARTTADDEPVGSARFAAPAMPPAEAAATGASVEIVGVAVLEDHRRLGIGGVVVSRLLDLAAQRDVGAAWLQTQSREAEHAYARAGFRTVSEAVHLRLPQVHT